jgi:hypothetical protein
MRRWIGLLICAGACGAQPAIFEFHSGFWANLHQFLCEEATASKPAPSDSPEWRDAVQYYRREVINHDHLGDEAATWNNLLSAAGSAVELPTAGLDPGLAATLKRAAAVYRREWWLQHERSNLAWIEAVEPLIAKYGSAIKKDIGRAYAVDWPAAPIRVDVSAHASQYGAYTTTDPAHITISSSDPEYQGRASLEMLFHEASHTLDEKLRLALKNELDSRGKHFRRRSFDHAILFYTAGETTRRYLTGYEPYGIRNGIVERGWPGSLPVLEKDWKPYLEGKVDLATAVHAVVEDYGVPKP